MKQEVTGHGEYIDEGAGRAPSRCGPPKPGYGSDQGRAQEHPLHGGLLPTQGRPNQGNMVFPLSLDLPQSWTLMPLPAANKPGLRIEGKGIPVKGRQL